MKSAGCKGTPILLHGIKPKVVRFIETEWRLSGSGKWELVFDGDRVSVWEDEKVQEIPFHPQIL